MHKKIVSETFTYFSTCKCSLSQVAGLCNLYHLVNFIKREHIGTVENWVELGRGCTGNHTELIITSLLCVTGQGSRIDGSRNFIIGSWIITATVNTI